MEGLDADEEVPFHISKDAGGVFSPGKEAAPGMEGPTIRRNVDAGVKVIDLAAMREELEKDPRSRRQW